VVITKDCSVKLPKHGNPVSSCLLQPVQGPLLPDLISAAKLQDDGRWSSALFRINMDLNHPGSNP